MELQRWGREVPLNLSLLFSSWSSNEVVMIELLSLQMRVCKSSSRKVFCCTLDQLQLNSFGLNRWSLCDFRFMSVNWSKWTMWYSWMWHLLSIYVHPNITGNRYKFLQSWSIYMFLLVLLSKLPTHKRIDLSQDRDGVAGLGDTVNGFLTKKWPLPNDYQHYDFCFKVQWRIKLVMIKI